MRTLQVTTIFALFVLFLIRCSKSSDTSVSPPTPPPPATFTISNLTYDPSEVAIRTCVATYTISGTLSFTNASNGVAKLRLATNIGSDTTILITGAENQTSGSLVGFFEFAMPNEPQAYSFQIWVIDGQGHESNKLSGSIHVIIDDKALNWTSIQIGNFATLNRVAWIQSAFIAIGNGGAIASSHCTGWTVINAGTNANLRALAWSGTQYVIVGEKNTILTSPDGINWTDRSLETADSFYYNLNAIVWTGSSFVAAGLRQGAEWGTAILTSIDGANWTIENFYVAHGEIRGIAWSGNELVAVGEGFSNALILTSHDGINWTNRSVTTSTSYLNDVIWTGSEFFITGMSICARSSDGNTWTINNSPGALNQVVFTGKKYVGVGNGVFVSDNGYTWSQTVPPNDLLYSLQSVAWSGTSFVAVGNFPYQFFVSP